jgi:dTDP-4-dehydrorhamnose 3,5-epimerase
MPAIFTKLPIEGLILVEPRAIADERGYFMETYKDSEFRDHGIDTPFVQDNHTSSVRSVLRGLHFQRSPHEQGKLVRVVSGRVWDVAVDLRAGSPTFAGWHGIELSAESRLMIYIPEGFAHGFVVLSEEAQLFYKCTSEYDRASDCGVRWNDPDIGIQWPITDVLVSAKDAALPSLRELG